MTEYLIVSPSIRRADALFEQLRDALFEHEIYHRSNGTRRIFTIGDVHIRIVTAAHYEEASRGFRGTILSSYEIEKALNEFILSGWREKKC